MGEVDPMKPPAPPRGHTEGVKLREGAEDRRRPSYWRGFQHRRRTQTRGGPLPTARTTRKPGWSPRDAYIQSLPITIVCRVALPFSSSPTVMFCGSFPWAT